MYKNLISKHLEPTIGAMGIEDVKTINAQNLINAISADGRNRTAQQVTFMLSQMFDRARKEKHIIENPMLDVERAHYVLPEKRALTDTEIEMVQNAAMPIKEKTFVMLLLHTGVRRGEALALTRADLDMKKGYVTISKNLYFESNQPKLKDPKTEAGKRQIPIDDALLPELKMYLNNLEGDILFPSAKGQYMSEISFKHFWERVRQYLHIAGVTASDITCHIFRHTFASWLVWEGVEIKDAQYVLGHASAKTTMDIYAHFNPKAKTNVKIRLNKRLIKSVVKPVVTPPENPVNSIKNC
jgi:integrase